MSVNANFYASYNISTDTIVPYKNPEISIGKFKAKTATIEDLTVNNLIQSNPEVEVALPGTPTTIYTLPITTGSWLINVLIAGVGSTPNDTAQWRTLVSVSMSVAGVITVNGIISSDEYSNGDFLATPGTTVNYVDNGAGSLLINVSSTIVPSIWRVVTHTVMASQ